MDKLINNIARDNFQPTICEKCNKLSELYIRYDDENESLCRGCYMNLLRESLNNHHDTHIDNFLLMLKIMSNVEKEN